MSYFIPFQPNPTQQPVFSLAYNYLYKKKTIFNFLNHSHNFCKMSQRAFKCPAISCSLSFSRQYNLNRHYERHHLTQDFVEKCLLCGQIFQTCEEIQNHYKTFHKPSDKFYEKESAFRKSVVSFRYDYRQDVTNFQYAQRQLLPSIQQLLLVEAGKKTLIKTSLIFICEMSMIDHVGEKITTTLIPFRAPSFLTNASSTKLLKKNIVKSFNLQEHELEQFTNSGSNWTFNRAVAFDVEVSAMRPVLVGNYNENDRISIKDIKNNRFLFNPANKDNKCFLYTVFNLFKEKCPIRFASKTFKQFESSLKLQGITFPISILHIKKFCMQNKHLNLKINILYRQTDGNIYPYEYGIGTGNIVLNLLMIKRNPYDLCVINHFLRITDVNKFLRNVYCNEQNDKSYKKTFTCLNCLNAFSIESRFKEHQKICSLNKPRKEEISKEKSIQFKNFKNQHPLEYIAFLDFECILPKNTEICFECKHLRCKCDRSFTHVISNQEPIAYSFIILDPANKIIHEKTYAGMNAANLLIDHLLEQEKTWIANLFSQFKELSLTNLEEKQFKLSSQCYLCKQAFTENIVKCRDHCHFSGKYLGPACQPCNLERRKQKKLKIFMHNGSKYDFHFIIKALNNRSSDIKNLYVLPYNGENFRTIQFNCFMFLDSLSFLQSSLAQLSEDLSKTNTSYNILKQTYLVKTDGKFDASKFKLVLGKSFFPYEYW